jgi:hypothetical protein
MTPKRPRGRPAGPSALERRRVEELLRSPPAHIPRMTAAERAELEESFVADERVRRQILKAYKHGATTPDAHAYDMASLGDESMEGHEAEVIARDHTYKEIADDARGKGGHKNRKKADRRAALVCEHFRGLLSRAVPLGPLSRSEVARRMQHRWPSDGRLGKLPSEKTLRNWIERGSPFAEHRVGKVLSGKK